MLLEMMMIDDDASSTHGLHSLLYGWYYKAARTVL